MSSSSNPRQRAGGIGRQTANERAMLRDALRAHRGSAAPSPASPLTSSSRAAASDDAYASDSESSHEEESWKQWRPLFFSLFCCVLLTAALGYIAYRWSLDRSCAYTVVGDWSSACDLNYTTLAFVQRRTLRDARNLPQCPDYEEERACTCDTCERSNQSTATGRSQCVPEPQLNVILPCEYQRIEVWTQPRCAMVDALVGVTLGPACGTGYYENLTGPCDVCSLDLFLADPPAPPPPEYPPGYATPSPSTAPCTYEPLVPGTGYGECYINETTGERLKPYPMVPVLAPGQTTLDCPSYNDSVPCNCSNGCETAALVVHWVPGECFYDPLSGQCTMQSGALETYSDCDAGLHCNPSSTLLNVSCTNNTGFIQADCPARPASPDYCTADANCTAGTPCQVGTCTDNICYYPEKNCTSGDGDKCFIGACNATSGACYTTARNCSDGNLCTGDLCSPGFAPHYCYYQRTVVMDFCYPNLDCNPLTGAWDILGTPLDCSDDDPCTTDTCDAGLYETDVCVHTPIGGCTGSCVTAGDCPAADPCFTNSCIGGLCYANATVCTTGGDPCLTAFCNTTTNSCATAPKDCDDHNLCTDDSCSGGTCAHTARCVDANPCHISSCNQVDGTCSVVNKTCPLLAPCTTYECNATTGNCQVASFNSTCAGVCTTADDCGVPLNTSDTCAYMICEDNRCVELTVAPSCVPDNCHVFQGLCNASDTPTPSCLYAELPTLDDDDVCTGDTCLNGVIRHFPACPQDPGDLCAVAHCNATGGPTCYTTNVTCSASPDPCFTNECQSATGTCLLVPLDCDDGDACTTDTCNSTAGGLCVHTPIVCASDNISCTDDICNSTLGKCVYTANASKCTTNNLCITGECSINAGGCRYVQTANASACSELGGFCNASTSGCLLPTGCDDHNPCTIDSTYGTGGLCQHTPKCPSTYCRANSCVPINQNTLGVCLLMEPRAGCCDTNADCGTGTGGICDTATHTCSSLPPTIINQCTYSNLTCSQPRAMCERNDCVLYFQNSTVQIYQCVLQTHLENCPHSWLPGYTASCRPNECPTYSGCWYDLAGTSLPGGCCLSDVDCQPGDCAHNPDACLPDQVCVLNPLSLFWIGGCVDFSE